MLSCILGLRCDSWPLLKGRISPLRINVEPFPEVFPDTLNQKEALSWKRPVFSSFLFGGCFGGSYLDTRTNTFLGISTSRGAAVAEVLFAYLLRARFCVGHGNNGEIPVPVSVGIYGHLPSNT